MKKKTVRNILLFALVPLAMVALAYLFISLYYMDRFYNGTWINGVNFSNKTVQEAKDSLIEYKASYNLRLIEPDGDQELLKGADIAYAAAFEAVDDIKKEQGMWTWFLSFMDVTFHTVESTISYDDALLKQAIEDLDCVSSVGATPPRDAYVEFTENGVNLVPEIIGTQVDKDKLFPVVKEALDAGKTRLNLVMEEHYMQPQVTTQSREIREIMAPVEKITGATITYTIGEATEVLDESITKTWIRKGEEGNVFVDAEKVEAFVQGLADKYNTVGNSREFQSTNSGIVTVPGGNYGWAIDVEGETEALMELLETGQSQEREPIYSATAAKWGGNEIGDTYIEISINEQHMWFYKDGALLVDTNIVTGKTSVGYYTPTGSYKVLNRLMNITLTGNELDGSTYESPVTFWLGFKGSGYGIHDASWRGDNQGNYGGQIYVYGGSHGCVNTPYSWVKQIFDNVEVNTPVLVY